MPLPRWRPAGQLLAVLFSAFAAVTCDLVTAPKPDEGSGIAVNYLGDTVLAVGTRIALAATVTQGGVPIEGARLSLTTTDASVIRVTDFPVGDDSIEVMARGRARIRATLQGSSLGDNPPFAEVEIRGVAALAQIDQATAVNFPNIGDSLIVPISVYDRANNRIDSVADNWTSSNPAIVSVNNRGRLLAQSNGTVNIIATVDTVADTIAVTVQQALAGYRFTPSQLVVTSLNQDTVVRATPLDAGGTPIPRGVPGMPTPAFTSLNTGVLQVTALTDTTFRVSSIANDTTSVRIVAGTLDLRYPITVGQVATTIAIQGSATPVIDALQDTLRLRARAFDGRNVEVQGRGAIWTSLNTAVATVDGSGLVTALSTGTVLVTSRMDAALDTVSITVVNLPSAIRTSQQVFLPTVKDSVVLSDTVLNKLGARLAGIPVSWRSLDPSIASVNATSGLVVAEAIGATLVIGQLANGAADTTQVLVANRVAGVAITHPDTTLGSIGDTVTIRADIRNARSALLPASSATWSLTDSSVASVSAGFVTALRQGFTRVIVSDPLNPARTDSMLLIVSNAPEQVTLNRVRDTLTAPTRTLQYVADVRNARGAVIAGANVTFRASNASIASISPSGLATALAVGSTAVIAEAGSGTGLRADTALLVVTNDAVALTVSPTTATIASVGATTPLVADARNGVGGAVTGVSFTWSSSDNTVATVSSIGVVTGVSVGTARITAQLAGLSAFADITVTNAPDTINIAPASVTLASINDSIFPPVSLVNALGAPLPRASAQWLSDDGTIAAVTSNGLVIAVGRGTTKIRARNPINTQRQDSVTVTVTNAPDSINVEQTLDSLPSLNRTLQYTAAVFNARRELIPGEPVTWTSRNGSIATVSATTGLATSAGIGSTYIVGTAGAVSDSARIVVSNFAASLQLNPAAISLPAINGTTTLTAIARNELGNLIVNPAATWSSANPAVASVSTAGPAASVTVTGAAVGSTTISATVDGITQTVNVAVANSPTTVSFTSGNVTLASIGDQTSPSITITNALGTTLARDAVLWTTSDPNVFTVSSTGLVTAIGAGAATLRATSPASGTVTSAITVTVTNAPATLAISPIGPTTLTSIGATANLSATVRNAAGAIIASPSPAVTWSSNNAAVTVNASTGVATAAAPGTATITATAGAASSTTTITVAPAASGARSTISASAASLTANGTATATITVQLKDAGGTNLTTSGGTVTMVLTGTGSLGAVTNNNNGSYTATLTAPTALGTGSISAAIGGSAITTGDPLVTYVAGPATRYILTVSNLTPIAGGSVTVTAQQADAFNNPVTTARTVTWSSTGGGAFAANPTATNASGIATATFTTNGSASTTHAITATDNVAITGTSGAVTTIAGAATNYLVTVSSSSPAAGSNVTVTAQLRDANNNPVSLNNVPVTWSKTGAGGSFAANPTNTNASGLATATFTVNTASGTTHTISATDGSARTGTSGNFTTTPSTASTATTTITSSSGTVSSGSTATITVQAKDANGNNLTQSAGVVALSATIGSLTSVTDNNNGSYTATFTGTTAGTAQITGTLAGSAIASNVNITVNAGTPASIAVNAGNNQTATAGTQVATAPSVIVRDAANNVVPGVGVTWTVTGGGGTTNPASGTTVSTLGTGISSLTSWTLGGTPGANTLTATAAGVPGSPVTFTATGSVGAPSTATSTITAASGSITAGGNTVITVQLKDAAGNNLTSSGGAVALFTTLGSLTAVADLGNGSYTATLSSNTAGSATITGTIQGNAIADNEVVTVNVGAASAAQSAATVPTGSAGSVTTITVQAKDAFGNNRTATSGVVTATVTGANNATGSVTDNTNGTYTITYTPTVAGSDAIAITLGGVAIGGSPYTSVVTAGALSTFLVEQAGGGAIVTQTAGTSFNVRVTAKDAFGNTVTTFTGAGNTVTFTSTSAISAGAGPSATFSSGVLASHAITLTTAGSQTITATRTAGGAENGASASFSVVAGAASAAQTTAVVPATGTAGQATNITIQAKDQFGNNRTSTSGTVTVQVSGANTVAQFNATNNGDGTYSASYTPAGTGADNVTIRLGGTQISGSPFTSTVGAGGLHHFAVTATGGGSIGTQTAGTSFNVRVVAQDISNNTVTGFTGTVNLTSSGTLVFTNPTASFSGGVLASAAVTITNTGSFTITATNAAGSETGSSNSFTVNAGALDHFNVEISGGGAIGTQTAGSSFDLRITARDANNNIRTAFTGGSAKVTIAASQTGCTLSAGTGTSAAFSNGVLDPKAVTVSAASTSCVITVQENGGSVTGSNTAFNVLGPISAATSTVSVQSNTVTSGSAITLTLQAKDALGQNLTTGGATVVFTRTGGVSDGTFGAVTDNGNGTYTGSFTGTTAGAATTIGATINTVAATSTQSVTVTPGAISAATSTVSHAGTVASGSGITVTLQAKDAAGNNRTTGGGTVVFTATGGTSTVTIGATTDNGDGTYTATLTGVLAGTATTIGATINTVATTSTQALTVTPGALANFLVEAAGGGAIGTQTSAGSFNIQVTARDAAGNTVTSFTGAGNTVDITLNQGTGTGTLTAGSGTTAAFTNGVLATHAVTITVTAAGTFSLTATRTGNAETGTSNTFQVN